MKAAPPQAARAEPLPDSLSARLIALAPPAAEWLPANSHDSMRPARSPIVPGSTSGKAPTTGHGLGQIRVRAAAEDAPRARALGALAYTVRDTVHLPPGLERPRTHLGHGLLAHETIHARQWRNGTGRTAPAWPQVRLEDEAHRLAPRLARGETVSVEGVHRGDRPLCHPIFISTHGRRAYLRLAEQFYVRWGYGTPIHVGSIEEMIGTLAGGRGALGKVTLVSHAVPANINISFLRGGPGFVLENEWAIDTLEELPQFAEHITDETFLDDVFRELRGDRAARAMLDALGPRDVRGDPIIAQYVWWLLDAWFVKNQRARGRRARRARDAVAAEADARAQTYRDLIALAIAATAGLGSGGGAFSFPGFERHFERVLADMRPGRVSARAARRRVRSGRNAAVDRIFGSLGTGGATFFDHLETVRTRLTEASHIEVQGCRVGRQPGYLDAMSTFFNGARVTAPDWFQNFGHVGQRRVARDDDRAMRRLWRNRAVRRAFAHWAPILTGDPLPDRPGWEDLAAYLRAGHPLLEGRLLLLVGTLGESALLDFLAHQGYRMTAEDELRDAFVEGRSLGDAVNFALVDWLQENRSGRGGIAFRPDPAYWDHIKSNR